MFSQNLQPTNEQRKIINELFTPEKIIEYSKTISNERIQYDIIKSLESKIDSLKTLSQKKDIVIIKYKNEIITLNNQIRLINQEENEIADAQLKEAKKPFLGLHLKTRLRIEEFQFDRINFSVNLSYDLKFFSIGISGWTQSVQDINTFTYKSQLYYGPFIEYKIF